VSTAFVTVHVLLTVTEAAPAIGVAADVNSNASHDVTQSRIRNNFRSRLECMDVSLLAGIDDAIARLEVAPDPIIALIPCASISESG